MSPSSVTPIRIMRIMTHMNVGGMAVRVSGLTRGSNSNDFDHRIYTDI